MVIDLEDKDRIVVFRLKDFEDIPVHVMMPLKKPQRSVVLRASDLGYDSFGDYTRMRVIKICETKENVLCCMLQKDFEESFKEEL